MREFLFLILILALACRVAQGMAAETVDVVLSAPVGLEQLSVTETLDGFSLIDIEVYEDEALGLRLRYLADLPSNTHVDVYAYPVMLPEMNSLANVLDFEQLRLDAEIEMIWGPASSDAPTRIESHFPMEGGIFRPGLMSIRKVQMDDAPLWTHSFLSVNHDLMFKVRMTVEGDEPSRRKFSSIVDQISGALQITGRPTEGLGVVVTLTTFEITGLNSRCAVAGWMGYGVGLRAALEEGHYLDSHERELAARQSALDFWGKMKDQNSLSGCRSTYFENLAKAQERNFLGEYVFDKYSQPYWTVPEDLRMSEYRSWARRALRRHQPVEFPGILIRWTENSETGTDDF